MTALSKVRWVLAHVFQKSQRLCICVLWVLCCSNVAHTHEALQGPTELRYWDAARAYNGYTLFGARGGTYLIDMEGYVVRTWSKVRTNPRFLDNGNILDSSTDDPSRGSGFVEVDWDDNVVWRYTEARSDYAPHHDFIRIFNQKLGAYTTLYIANKSINHEQAIAAGCDPSRNYKDAQMDAIVEVDMDGNIVWEWWFFDHVVQDIDPTRANYVGEDKTIADYPGRIDINLPGRPLKRDWLHCNSLDYHLELGHIVTNSVQGEFYVIDHDGTFIAGDPQASIDLAASEAGDFLYRFGDPARYEQGDPPSILEDWTKCTSGHKQIGGAHDVQWIDAGLPGAGHFLIFNNGQYLFERTNQSYIFEINGFLNANGQDTGGYVNPPDAGYTKVEFHHDTHKPNKLLSNQIVWEYHSKSNQGFFSHIGSGAQRLPNGNTLICSDTEGHLFEVTSKGELVWEYINPMTREYGPVTVMPDSLPMTNSVFRAYRYGADHPALVGRDLTPGNTITGKEPSYTTPEILSPVTSKTMGRITGMSTLVKNKVRQLSKPRNVTQAYTSKDALLLATQNILTEFISESVTTLARLLPDTGQLTDYTTTWGEDSDYTIYSPSYTDHNDGTITDNVTGLMWQKTDGGSMTWTDAMISAELLILGDYSDWRLPDAGELFNLMDHGRPDPAIDTTFFPHGGAQYWWTSQQRADDPDRIWLVNAGGGLGAHRKTESLEAGGDRAIHVRCVRGPMVPSTNRWIDQDNGTIEDKVTRLIWQKTGPTAKMTWEQALVHAEELALAGQEDWRLPNIKELRTLTDITLTNPAIDLTVFPDSSSDDYWSSTTLAGHPDRAWTVNFRFGIVSYQPKTADLLIRCVRGPVAILPDVNVPVMQHIQGGTFAMGDHHDLGGAEHRNDEVPIHLVTLDNFYIGLYEITNQEYCDFLNDALLEEQIVVDAGYVTDTRTGELLCDTYQSDGYSRIQYDGDAFSVSADKESHPVVGIRWFGAISYCNWLSQKCCLSPCYDLDAKTCDFFQNSYRLPTEAEWEYAGRGGLYDPYAIYPWGDDPDNSRANWPNSGDPYEAGPMPYTTPVGFYDGREHFKTDFNWPGSSSTYQTRDGSNGYGLYDMAGNVWEWTNDLYHSDYYSVSPRYNPPGPTTGKPMPDGKIYHVLRSGNWYNGPQGHSRVSNRNPAHFRGPQDPYHPWYHIGFRIVRSSTPGPESPPQTVTRPGAQTTIVADGFDFAEGPAANSVGELFFSDLQARRIYKLNNKGEPSIFLQDSGGANGLFFDTSGNLIACQGDLGRLVSISEQRDVTVLADTYQGKRFNKPNDLWIDPHGGIYFSDPAYGTKPIQDGEHVYYISADRTSITRVINNMVRPNGLIGVPDGQILYVADHGDGKVYVYDIKGPGILSNKRLFVSKACDGMTIDRFGNVYITNESSVLVYNPTGELIEQIQAEGQVTNVCFSGLGASTLYVTSTHTLFSVDMQVSGFVPTSGP
jgi:gluconolactonase